MTTSDAATFDATALTRLPRVSAVAPSPCGRYLAVAVARLDERESTYVTDLWRVSLDGDADPIQLTRGPSKDGSPMYRHDGSLGFLSDRNPRDGAPEPGDDTRAQVWLLPAAGGEPIPLTDEPLGVREFRFADTGELFTISDVLLGVPHEEQRSRAADRAENGPTHLHYDRLPVRHWDHWLPAAAPHVVAHGGGARRDLTPEADREHRDVDFGVGWDVSRDGRRVVVTTHGEMGSDDIRNVSLRVIDVESGAHRDLGSGDTLHDAPRFSPDGTRIACTRIDRRPGVAMQPRLWMYGADGADEAGRALAEWDAWPVVHGWTRDGGGVICTADTRAHVPVFRVDVAGGEVTRITAVAAGGSHAQLAATPDGAAVVGIRSRLTQPPEPFRVALAPDAEPTLVARFTDLDGDSFAAWDAFEVAADDGAVVHSMLLKPAAAPEPLPLLLWIHGGPVSQWADGWHWRWNPLVPAAAGYAVLLPNPRGSSGYGQDFIAGIWNNEWGGACFTDLMAATDAACARADVDETRTAAMGGSFGGYMANWIGGNTDRFACLVTHAGLYHFEAFHGATDHAGYFAHELASTPDGDRDAFNRHSPHTRIAQWTTPTLIVHGERDYRVPIGDALILFENLQRRGVPSELLVFPDENHWILRPRNAREWYRNCLDFIARHLSVPRPESARA